VHVRAKKQAIRLKHGGGSVFSASGSSSLVRTEGKMNGEKYREILDENLIQSTQDLRQYCV
jgi:hypothetical protein